VYLAKGVVRSLSKVGEMGRCSDALFRFTGVSARDVHGTGWASGEGGSVGGVPDAMTRIEGRWDAWGSGIGRRAARPCSVCSMGAGSKVVFRR
jgi:hypothetical protein